jgi:flagellar hook-length control protein FliK
MTTAPQPLAVRSAPRSLLAAPIERAVPARTGAGFAPAEGDFRRALREAAGPAQDRPDAAGARPARAGDANREPIGAAKRDPADPSDPTAPDATDEAQATDESTTPSDAEPQGVQPLDADTLPTPAQNPDAPTPAAGDAPDAVPATSTRPALQTPPEGEALTGVRDVTLVRVEAQRQTAARAEAVGERPVTIHTLNSLMLAGGSLPATVERSARALREPATPTALPDADPRGAASDQIPAGDERPLPLADRAVRPDVGLRSDPVGVLAEAARPQREPADSKPAAAPVDRVQAAQSERSASAASAHQPSDPKPAPVATSALVDRPSTQPTRTADAPAPSTKTLGLGPLLAARPGQDRGLNTADRASRTTPDRDPAALERFTAQIARGVGAAIKSTDGTATLRLRPEALGELKLSVQMNGQAVTARFEAATPEARDLLERSLPMLRDRLEAKGLKVERFEVHLVPTPAQDAQAGAGSAPSAEPASAEHTSDPAWNADQQRTDAHAGFDSRGDPRGNQPPADGSAGWNPAPASDLADEFEFAPLGAGPRELSRLYVAAGGRLGVDAIA